MGIEGFVYVAEVSAALFDPRPIGTTTRPSEVVDSVDDSRDRQDIRGGADELHRRGPVQHEFVAATVHDRRQVAVASHDDQPARVRQGPRALSDTIPLTLRKSVELAVRSPLDVDEHARPAGYLARLASRAQRDDLAILGNMRDRAS
jgi:hypothetical protein